MMVVAVVRFPAWSVATTSTGAAGGVRNDNSAWPSWTVTVAPWAATFAPFSTVACSTYGSPIGTGSTTGGTSSDGGLESTSRPTSDLTLPLRTNANEWCPSGSPGITTTTADSSTSCAMASPSNVTIMFLAS